MNTRNLPLGYTNAAGEVVEREGKSGARLSHALQQRFTGPHRLLQAQGDNAFEPDIPEHLRISRTCNVAEFKRDQVDHSRPQAPPPPIHVARTGQAEYDIERIVSWRERAGAAEFEVKWAGYAEADNTWVPYTNLTRFGSGSKAIFKAFVNGVNGQCLRQLLPKAHGGTGGRRRRARLGSDGEVADSQRRGGGRQDNRRKCFSLLSLVVKFVLHSSCVQGEDFSRREVVVGVRTLGASLHITRGCYPAHCR